MTARDLLVTAGLGLAILANVIGIPWMFAQLIRERRKTR